MTSAPVARDFHERTKHFPGGSRETRRVDAALVPNQYKRYLDLPSMSLPPPATSGRSFFDVVSGESDVAGPLTAADLAAVLHYSAGIVRRTHVSGRDLAFRAASCTGALYHVELYVVCSDIDDGLLAGLYHYDVIEGALRPLRTGDYRGALAEACCDGAITTAAASVVVTSTFWRNAWRYEERAYRHVFWDAGTLLANLLTLAGGRNLQPVLRTAFVDAGVNALLGLDSRREAAVAVVSLGVGTPAVEAPPIAPLGIATEPLSRAEIEYPLIWQTHAASSLRDCAAVQAWREAAAGEPPASAAPTRRDALSLEASIERRGSARRFSDAPIRLDALQAVLAAARGSLRNDDALASVLVQTLLITNRVEGLEAGAYTVAAGGGLSLMTAGDFSAEATDLALDQGAAGSAAANLYFVASSRDAATIGERGYRALQLEAGIRTGQIYLATTALGLRCTGLTFYDDEAASFFGLDPADTMVLMLVALGAPRSA